MSNLRDRRLDRLLNESTLSKSASASMLPEDVKYLVESMQPVGNKHNAKSLEAAENVKNHLEKGLNLHFTRAYRTQGSVRTNTNIKVHSDFDLLVVIDRYFYPEVSSTGNDYTESIPDSDIVSLRKQSTEIMKKIYDEVNDSGEKGIHIFNKNLRQKVDLVFCFWYHSQKYVQTNDEYYKGIYLYDFIKNKKQDRDFPFAMIHNVNNKGDQTLDGSRRGIRLLKTLKADSEESINNLKSFHLTSIVHSIDSPKLSYQPGNELQIARSVSDRLDHLIHNSAERKSLQCPKGTEKPLTNDNVVHDMTVIKRDLDILISDTQNELSKSDFVRKAILTY